MNQAQTLSEETKEDVTRQAEDTPKRIWKKWILFCTALLISGVAALVLYLYYSLYVIQHRIVPGPNPVVPNNYFPSPIPDPTANWKTYTNDTFLFSIQYPSDWTVFEYENNKPPKGSWVTAFLAVFKPGPKAFEPGITGIDKTITVSVSKNDTGLQVLDWIKKYGDMDGLLPDSYYQGTTIGNYDAIKINFTPSPEIIKLLESKGYLGGQGGSFNPYTSVYIKKDKLVFNIVADQIKEDEEFNTLFDQILPTFKFTSETTTEKKVNGVVLENNLGVE